MARRLRVTADGAQLPEPVSLRRMIRRWEAEGLRTERYELMYARALGVPAGDLAAGPIAVGVSSLLPAVGGEDGDDAVKRREFGGLALGVLVGAVAPPLVPGSVSAEHVRELREAVAGLWVRDWQVGTGALRDATRCYAAARAMLDESRYTSVVGDNLLSVTAELAACAGFIAFDADQQGMARSLLTESALLAGSAGDSVRTAHAYSLLALQSSSLAAAGNRMAHARQALRFLGMAGAAARNVPSPKVHAVIAMRRATSSALLGDEPDVRRFTAAAHRELDSGDHPSDPGWAAFVTPAEVTAHEGMARLTLGQPARAAEVFRAVLADETLPVRNRVYYDARLSGALHAAGDRSQAVSEGLRALSGLEGPVRSARTLNWLRPVRRGAPGDSEFAARFDVVSGS